MQHEYSYISDKELSGEQKEALEGVWKLISYIKDLQSRIASLEGEWVVSEALKVVCDKIRSEPDYYNVWKERLMLHFQNAFLQYQRDGEVEAKFKYAFSFEDMTKQAAESFLNPFLIFRNLLHG
jgi:hypothetical protein